MEGASIAVSLVMKTRGLTEDKVKLKRQSDPLKTASPVVQACAEKTEAGRAKCEIAPRLASTEHSPRQILQQRRSVHVDRRAQTLTQHISQPPTVGAVIFIFFRESGLPAVTAVAAAATAALAANWTSHPRRTGGPDPAFTKRAPVAP